MRNKQRYVLRVALFWGLCTAIATEAWGVLLDHHAFNLEEFVIRLLCILLGGISFALTMWSRRSKLT